jgi:hypothetical protein
MRLENKEFCKSLLRRKHIKICKSSLRLKSKDISCENSLKHRIRKLQKSSKT